MAVKSGDEPPILLNAQVLYREWGRRFTALQAYLKAIQYYEESAEHGDENIVWILLGLSVALKKSGQFKAAADVAEKCMSIDPTHLGANYTRMEALYDVAEFCLSLVYAHRGARRRQNFRAAVILATETIDNCVGRNVPRNMLHQIRPWIHNMTVYRDELRQRLSQEEDEFAGIDEDASKFKENDPASHLNKHRKKLDRMMALVYLGLSCHEKTFLEDLLKHKALPSANREGSKNLVETTNGGMNRLQSQQDALRMRHPPYAKRASRKQAETVGNKIAAWCEYQVFKCLTRNRVKHLLRSLHETRLRRDYLAFFKLVEIAKVSFDEISLRVLPDRQRYMDALYRMVARAYIDPRNLLRFSPGRERIRNDYLIRLLGLKGPKLPRDIDLAWPFCPNVKVDLDLWRQRLALACQPLEKLWIFHEIARLYLQIRRFDMARFYAKKTRDLSMDSGYEEWAILGTHIIIRIELVQNNRPEAKEAAQTALDCARRLSLEFLIDFYVRVVDFIDELDFGHMGGEDSLTVRRRVINGLMLGELRAKMDKLMASILTVPGSRQLALMPGFRSKDENAGKRRSIIAGPPEDYVMEARDALLKRFAPRKKIPGYMDFSKY